MPQGFSGAHAGVDVVLHHDHPIHQHEPKAGRVAVRVVEGGVVLDGGGIENDEIGPRAGSNLAASGFPVSASPLSRGLTFEAGFPGTATPATADKIKFWKGDATPGAIGATSYFHLDAGDPFRYWTLAHDPLRRDYDRVGLFAPNRAVFLIVRHGAASAYSVPPPWTEPAPEMSPRPAPAAK